MSENSSIAPPRWMSRAQKKAFEAIKEARKAAGNPLLTTEADLAADYVESRTRLATLRKMLGKEKFDKDVVAITRQIDTTTALSRRLGRELQLSAGAAIREEHL